MSNIKAYFITDESPAKMRKLLIRYPFLPTLYDNVKKKNPLNDSIKSLDLDDPVIEFLVQQLLAHDLLVRKGDGFEAAYSRIVPPPRWDDIEHHAYIENVLSNLKDIVIKQPNGKVGFGNWTGSATEAEFLAFAEHQIASGNAFTEKPDGSVKYQFTFLLKQL